MIRLRRVHARDRAGHGLIDFVDSASRRDGSTPRRAGTRRGAVA